MEIEKVKIGSNKFKINTSSLFSMFFILLASVLFYGCNSSVPSTSDAQKLYQVKGQVTVTPGEQNAFIAFNPYKIFSDFLSGPVFALTGLVPVTEGTEVKVIRIDDNGYQIGDSLGTSKTDKDGGYAIELETGKVTLPASDIILEVQNKAKDKTLRAFITKELVDITPATTVAVNMVVEVPDPLRSFSSGSLYELAKTADDISKTIDASTLTLVQAIDSITGLARQNTTFQNLLRESVKTTITGNVLTPTGKLASNSITDRLANIIIPPAQAVTGLLSVGKGIKVTLYKIDEDGKIISGEIASAQTASDGRYTINLPKGTVPAGDLIASVGSAQDKNLMRAVVYTYSNIRIDPVSEACVKALLDTSVFTGENKVPISKFTSEKIANVLNAIGLASNNIDITSSVTIDASVQNIYNVIKTDATVKNIISSSAGLPPPTVDSVPKATTKEVITITGSARPGSFVQITGGTSTVQSQLTSDKTNFSIDVPLQKNSTRNLYITSTIGTDTSAPATIAVRNDTISPVIDSAKITISNPDPSTYKSEIKGSKGAISDAGPTTVIITNPKVKNSSVRVTATTDGGFSTSLQLDMNDILTFQVIDDAGNSSTENISAKNPGLSIVYVSPIAAAAGDTVTIVGSGFDTTAANNTVVFGGPSLSTSVNASSIATDNKTLTAIVPKNLSSNLGLLPVDVNVKVTNKNGVSNDNKTFKLTPAVKKLNATLKGDGQSQYMVYDSRNNVILGTSQEGHDSYIAKIDMPGNLLMSEMTGSTLPKPHYSMFMGMDFDSNGDVIVSNYDSSLAGQEQINSITRPLYRLTKYFYDTTNNNVDKIFTNFSDISSDLGGKPGNILISGDYAYVPIPENGKIMRVELVHQIVTTFAEGIKTPIKDILFDSSKKKMFVSCGDNISIYKITLDSTQEKDGLINHSIDNNFVNDIGTGSGRLALDVSNNVYVALGAGIDIITTAGSRRNFIPSVSGKSVIGLLFNGNNLYVNDIDGNVYMIAP